MAYELVDAVADLKEEEALRIVKEKLMAGEDPLKVLELCRKGMEIVGNRFEKKEYFLIDLIMAGEIFREIMEMVKPSLEKVVVKRIGKVVIGTVQNDIHNIGKDIVILLLEAAGFEVYDLGVDVPPEKFVEKIKEHQPQIVGLSCLLSSAYDSMKRTVESIKEAGSRAKVKIIIGGNPITEQVMKYVGADAFTTNAVEGVEICKKWMSGQNGEESRKRS